MPGPAILAYSEKYSLMAGIRHKDGPCRASVVGSGCRPPIWASFGMSPRIGYSTGWQGQRERVKGYGKTCNETLGEGKAETHTPSGWDGFPYWEDFGC